MELQKYKMPLLGGEMKELADYENKVVLIVNTASKCGFTPQYQTLEELYNKYKDQGLVILGFPCNQFGRQEPGDSEEIGAFCQKNYGVTFPMFEKIEVNGDHAAPLYKDLKSEAPGLLGTQKIKWNFTKFLIGRKGEIIDRYAPTTKPEDIEEDICKALRES
ncbi:glutathione peroxidase [Salinisphaera sp. G21_0]|uniref:glutathione peroxidase n=2 Tax=Gammaproteobacteria TaxID=1236 RepID=UPI001ADA9071|nr:glutathione peroxidase [Salinisphaera sp. G21_0]MBO9496121.1 glutathione peroxidase [Thalassotalea sp. G20_0]